MVEVLGLLEGDVTSLPPGAGTGHRFVLDVGCFHGLSDPQRLQMGRQVGAVTDETATMLVLSFAPGPLRHRAPVFYRLQRTS